VAYALGVHTAEYRSGITPALRSKLRRPSRRTTADLARARRRRPWLRKLRAANTNSGMTTVNGGTLALAKPASVNAIGGNLTVATGGTVLWNAADQVPNSAAVSVSGGTLNFNGNNETFTSLASNAAVTSNVNTTTSTLTLDNGSGVGTVTVTGGGQLSIVPTVNATTIKLPDGRQLFAGSSGTGSPR